MAVVAAHITAGAPFGVDRKGGELRPTGPTVGKAKPGITPSGRHYGRNFEFRNHISETPEDCKTGSNVMRQRRVKALVTEEPDE